MRRAATNPGTNRRHRSRLIHRATERRGQPGEPTGRRGRPGNRRRPPGVPGVQPKRTTSWSGASFRGPARSSLSSSAQGLSTTAPSSSPTTGAWSPRSSAVPVPAPVTRSLTVKACLLVNGARKGVFMWLSLGGCCCDRASGRALLLGCVESFSLPVCTH